MARSRNIKPSLFKNELLGEADPLLTILFAGLWCLADREGRLEDRPKRIKAEIFPYRELPDFNGYLTELARLGFIDRYEVEGQPIIHVCEFAKHQSPHKTERPSDLPEKPLKTNSCESTVKAPLNNGTATEVAALIPDSLLLTPDSLNLIPDSEEKDIVGILCREIIDYLNQKTGKNYTYADTHFKFIRARINAGFGLDDFKYVVDIKTSQWLGTKEDKYLRPETLFGTKFEGYANEKPIFKQSDESVLGRVKQRAADRQRQSHTNTSANGLVLDSDD